MEELMKNTGLLVIGINIGTQALKVLLPKAKPSTLAKFVCFFTVGIFTLANYVISPKIIEYAITQLVLVYTLSTTIYDIYTNKKKNV